MSGLRVMVCGDSAGTFSSPISVRIRFSDPRGQGVSTEVFQTNVRGETRLDIDAGSSIEDVVIVDEGTNLVLPLVGHQVLEDSGEPLLYINVELPPRHISVELIDGVTREPNSQPVSLSLWVSSQLHTMIHGQLTQDDVRDSAKFQLPFDAEIHRASAIRDTGQALELEPTEELASMVAGGALRFIVGEFSSDNSSAGFSDFEFSAILSCATFERGNARGGNPMDLGSPMFEPYTAQIAYDALLNLGRIDYTVTWQGWVVCWHTVQDTWVVPGSRQADPLHAEVGPSMRAQTADVLEMALGLETVYRGPLV